LLCLLRLRIDKSAIKSLGLKKIVTQPPLPASTAYQHLRNWYLARLRRTALTDGTNSSITPATLIKRDRAALEQLISQTAEPPIEKSPSWQLVAPGFLRFAKKYLSVVISVAFIIFANLVGLVWLLYVFHSATTPGAVPIWLMVALFSISTIVAIMLTFAFFQISSTLSAVTEHEQSIADYALDALWSLDESLHFLAVSPATKRLWGLDANDLLRANISQVLIGDCSKQVNNAFAEAKLSRFPITVEAQVYRKDRTAADVDLTIEYSNTEAIFFCVAIDISERKEAERYKQQIMSMLSHDLKTPLTSVQFSLALVAKGKYGVLSEDGLQVVQLGKKNIDKSVTLINQLLELHKSDAKKMELNIAPVQLKLLIEDAVESVQVQADTKNTSLEISCENLVIPADADRMLHVFINLLANAVKYSPPGSTVSISGKSLPGDWLAEIRVTDNGPGIALAHQKKIFDSFYRIESDAQSPDGPAEPDRPDGTGLGLALCKAVIEAHGGKIGVDSQSGKGASFWCQLPVTEASTFL
jgi:PAS domain S-box-containing protein